MSTDSHRPSATGFRCEAITTHTISPPCVHERLENVRHLEPHDSKAGRSDSDDPAVLIGLAFAFIRQGRLLDGHVPEPLMLRLSALEDEGNPACRLLIDWLPNRNRDLARPKNERLASSIPAIVSADTLRLRRSPRDRVLAASAKSGPIDGRRRIRRRPRDLVQNPETAIIAADTGGRVDG
ncbi:hypothetical protein LJR255_002391 [Pararhizobium sp. LjRoot255]|uniref:hypothetical protein n=1 Tax=Pararhizobium sp. LjRoot255 TaxID=3342298 RepID=UPI003ED13425